MAQKIESKLPHEINERLFNILVKEGLIKEHDDQLIKSVDISLSLDEYPKVNVVYGYREKLEV